jgi:hypothetical protein
MTQTKLVRSRRLLREWEVTDGSRFCRLTYDGNGIGYESVLIDNQTIKKTRSWFWYVPRFDFEVYDMSAVIEVRVWPWLAIRAIRLKISDQILHQEGTI